MEPAELAELLKKLYQTIDERLQNTYDRSLPFADGLFDRWERAERLGFGRGTSVYNSSLVFGQVKIGENTWIGPYTLLDGSGGRLEIGSFCSISAGVHIYTHDTVYWALSGGELEKRVGSVRIGDCVYIGSQSIILAGVQIGSRCLIAANSVVNRNVPDGTIVGGTPACRIGMIEGHGKDVCIRFDENS